MQSHQQAKALVTLSQSQSSLAQGTQQMAVGGERTELRKEPAREERGHDHTHCLRFVCRVTGPIDFFYCFPASRGVLRKYEQCVARNLSCSRRMNLLMTSKLREPMPRGPHSCLHVWAASESALCAFRPGANMEQCRLLSGQADLLPELRAFP